MKTKIYCRRRKKNLKKIFILDGASQRVIPVILYFYKIIIYLRTVHTLFFCPFYPAYLTFNILNFTYMYVYMLQFYGYFGTNTLIIYLFVDE